MLFFISSKSDSSAVKLRYAEVRPFSQIPGGKGRASSKKYSNKTCKDIMYNIAGDFDEKYQLCGLESNENELKLIKANEGRGESRRQGETETGDSGGSYKSVHTCVYPNLPFLMIFRNRFALMCNQSRILARKIEAKTLKQRWKRTIQNSTVFAMGHYVIQLD